MMEIKPPFLSKSTDRTAQKRQRNHLFSRAHNFEASQVTNNVASSSTPKFQPAKKTSNETLRKRRIHEGLFRESVLNENSLGQNVVRRYKSQDLIVGAKAIRECRSFTVTKVGNNGKIYLCPTDRPSNENFPQISIASTSNFSTDISVSDSHVYTPSLSTNNFRSIFTPPPSRGTRELRRIQSSSTLDGYPREKEDDEHTKTSNCGPLCNPLCHHLCEKCQHFPTLEIPIPSFRLGSPQFSEKGTAVLIQSPSRRHSDASQQPYFSTISRYSQNETQILSSQSMLKRLMIVPEIFDALTMKPTCDYPSVIRYSASGRVSAATPSRLIAEITSPAIVDYDLLSNFFLTFRSFLSPEDLMHLLVARLEWSFLRFDSLGTVVSVRTFVALRHWILNYFSDDFLMNWELRKLFCDLVNDFVNQISQEHLKFKVPLKILGEIKKCWRKACSSQSKNSELAAEQDVLLPIYPGEYGDSSDSYSSTNSREQQFSYEPSQQTEYVNQPTHAKLGIKAQEQNILTHNLREPLDSVNLTSYVSHRKTSWSSKSIDCEEVISSSVANHHQNIKLESHRGPLSLKVSSVHEKKKQILADKVTNTCISECVQTHQQGLVGCRDCHKACQPTQNEIHRKTKLHFKPLCKNCLVLGEKYFPESPSFDIMTPATNIKTSNFSTYPSRYSANYTTNSKVTNNMSGPGIKKIFGSVRRAFISRTDQITSSLHTQKCISNLLPIRSREAAIDLHTDMSISPSAYSSVISTGVSKRVDKLSVEVAKDLETNCEFKIATVNDKSSIYNQISRSKTQNSDINIFTSHFNSKMRPYLCGDEIVSTSCVTTDERSVVVNNSSATRSFLFPSPAFYPSVNSIPTAYMRSSSGPTPPTTPPETCFGISQCSLSSGELSKREKNLPDGTPSLSTDLDSSEDERSPSFSSRTRVVTQPLRRHSFEAERPRRFYSSFNCSYTNLALDPSFNETTYSQPEIGDSRSSSNCPSIPIYLRRLRRRPGGYLRPVNHLKEIETSPDQSISSSSYQVCSSKSLRQVTRTWCSETGSQIFSLGHMTEQVPRNSTPNSESLLALGSFEDEFRFLAQLPDDEEDDGTAECALLKLEGKFKKLPKDISSPTEYCNAPEAQNLQNSFCENTSLSTVQEKDKRKRRNYTVETPFLRSQISLEADQLRGPKVKSQDLRVYQPDIIKVASLQSVEILNNNMLVDCNSSSENDLNKEIDFPLVENEKILTAHSSQTSEHSYDSKIDSTSTSEKINIPYRKHQHEIIVTKSFFQVESDKKSNVSNEIVYNIIPQSDDSVIESALDNTISLLNNWASSVMEEGVDSSDQSIPLSNGIEQNSEYSSEVEKTENFKSNNQTSEIESSSPENTSPAPSGRKNRAYRGASITMDPLRLHLITANTTQNIPPSHLPFILAFNSNILAQQFTLVEKEVVNEINWRDLVEMQWKDSPLNVRSWVKFLRSRNKSHGVEFVLARFNLMVKWVISECVLTQDLNERVNCFIKFIHIADKCRQYRNFATMAQIIIALTSQNLASLVKTWSHVPPDEIQRLQKLEALLDASRNHYSLRAEMECAVSDECCIPLVLVYTNDLMMNYDNPLKLPTSPKSEPLINFEKCRMDAIIIKNLLRLVEASRNYVFSPVEDLIDKCYWITALKDEQIFAHIKLIQD